MRAMKKAFPLAIVLALCAVLAGCGGSGGYTLTMAVTGQGTTAPAPGAHQYDKNAAVTVAAIPAEGWAFSGWTGDAAGTANPLDLTMSGDKSVTATFIQLQYDLTASVEPEAGAGSVAATLVETKGKGYTNGQTVSLEATANTGWVFDHWAGNLTGAVNPQTLIMDGPKTVTAVFVKAQHDLTVQVDPAGAGTVDQLIVPQAKGFAHGETVRLTANPNLGYVFGHWDDDTGDTANPKDIVIDSARTLTAHFVPAIKGRVLGVRTNTPLAGITVSFSDGGTAVTDANGYWIKKYEPGHVPTNVTVTPLNGTPTPASVTITWPAADILFYYAGYLFSAKWGTYGTGDGQFYGPYGVAADAAGNVYVADVLGNHIQEFTGGGTCLAKWGTKGSDNGQFAIPYGVAVDAARYGYVYVADAENKRIQQFTGDGFFLAKWGIPSTDDDLLPYPTGVAVDAVGYGRVYVADANNHCIKNFRDDGTLLTKWGTFGSGDGQFYSPYGMAADAAGNVYVADSSNHRIQKFTGDGAFLAKWGSNGSGDGQFYYPYSVAVDAAGNVYVGDSYNHRIQKFAGDGTFLTKWGTYGSGDGQFDHPYGVAVDAAGNVYVADYNNHRIQKFKWGD